MQHSKDGLATKLNNDRNTWWRPGRIYIPVNQFTGVQVQATMKGGAAGTAIGYDADAANWKITKAAATDRKSVNVAYQAAVAAAADPSTTKLVTLTGLNIQGMIMTTAADEIQHFQMLPDDFDPQYPIYTYVWWTCEAAAVGARTITWRVRYTKIVPNTTAAIASPATALDTTIGAQAPAGTSLVIQRTTEALAGKVNGGSFADNVAALQLRVDMSAFDASLTENKYLVGLELRYTPRRFYYGDGMAHEAKAPIDVFGKVYS